MPARLGRNNRRIEGQQVGPSCNPFNHADDVADLTVVSLRLVMTSLSGDALLILSIPLSVPQSLGTNGSRGLALR